MSRVNAGKIEEARFTDLTILIKMCASNREHILSQDKQSYSADSERGSSLSSSVSAIRIFKGIKGKQLMDCLIKNICLFTEFSVEFRFFC